MEPGDVTDKSSKFVDPAEINLGLSPREVLELALWLEKARIEFYRLLSEETKPEPLRIFFLKLMGMEMAHQRLIQDMLAADPGSGPKKAGFDETLTHREFFVRLREMRAFWEKRPGVKDLTRMPGYDPIKEYQLAFKEPGQGAGYRHQYRFDISDDDMEK